LFRLPAVWDNAILQAGPPQAAPQRDRRFQFSLLLRRLFQNSQSLMSCIYRRLLSLRHMIIA
jgi:hypothetical protein